MREGRTTYQRLDPSRVRARSTSEACRQGRPAGEKESQQTAFAEAEMECGVVWGRKDAGVRGQNALFDIEERARGRMLTGLQSPSQGAATKRRMISRG